MFKKNFSSGVRAACPQVWKAAERNRGHLLPSTFNAQFPPGRLAIILLCLILFISTGCHTSPLLPKADLSEPGWKTYQGEAIWRANHHAPEIAGEILLATNATGRTFVQFTKTPFPFVIAQTTTNIWQIESPTQNRIFAGHGSPPARVLWFQLPCAWSGSPLPRRWIWKETETGWHLENTSNGETLEGYFNAGQP